MLAAWSRSRSPALADAIQVADPDRWKRPFSTIARFKKGLATGRIERLPDDDPRVTVFLVQCLHAARWAGPTCKDLWAIAFEKLVALRDVRAVPALRAAVDRPPPILGSGHAAWLAKTLATTADAIEAKPPRDDAASKKLAAAWATKIPATGFFGAAKPSAKRTPAPADVATIVQAVFDAPDDTALRMVVADQLLELGDPWGELITLQRTAKRPTPTIKKLIETHFARFAGPIAFITKPDDCVFENGFLAALAVGGRAPRPRWEAAIPALHWATVRRLEIGYGTPAWWLTELSGKAPIHRIRIALYDLEIELAGRTNADVHVKKRRISRFALRDLSAIARGWSAALRTKTAKKMTDPALREAIESA
jgi:uncharacterized protein (TIGR02996 family)